jgi:hypothetical protein
MLDQLGVPASPNGRQAGSQTASADDARGFSAISPDSAMAAGTRLPTPAPVFPRIEVEEVAAHAPAPAQPSSAPPPVDDSWLDAIQDVESAVREQGDLVRSLKTAKADKAQIAEQVEKLMKMKSRLPAPSK